MDFTGGLADEIAKLPAELQPIMAALVTQVDAILQQTFDRVDALEEKIESFGDQVVSGVLADITAERVEMVNDIHGFIDRINLPQIIRPRG